MDELRAMVAGRRAGFAIINALSADLEKTATNKRASLPRAAEHAKSFFKDWQRMTHFGRHDMVRLKEAMLFIGNDALLGLKCLGCALDGGRVDHRKCRIGNNLLVFYQIAGRLQTPEKQSLEIFTADTLGFRRYSGQVSRTREGLERQQFRAEGWETARRKHD